MWDLIRFDELPSKIRRAALNFFTVPDWMHVVNSNQKPKTWWPFCCCLLCVVCCLLAFVPFFVGWLFGWLGGWMVGCLLLLFLVFEDA